MLWNKDKLFCDINPTCFAISMQKEIAKRHLQNLFSKDQFANTISSKKLPNVAASYHSHLIKRGKGIDPRLQKNKAVNIEIACSTINGLIIHPGEVFSFWGRIGKTTKRKGYRDGRVIEKNAMKPGIGGGLCNLGNTIHRIVLHSPMTVTEFHSHSDALAPDEGPRVPFSSGTSINYNNRDYRFRNDTDQDVQLLLWCEDETLYAELRSEKEYPWTYQLVEEDHHFAKEGDKYFRISKIYKETLDRESGKLLKKELVLDNHSEVMYDYSLIPEELIRE
jgi:vancomycin resistance protein VanW